MSKPAQDKDGQQRHVSKRGAARLGAVQALYQMDIGGKGMLETVSEFENLRLGKEVDGEQFCPADEAFFRDIVAGVIESQRQLDPLIHNALTDDWPLKRIDATLRAILRGGAFELLKRKDVPVRVIINEYIDVAHAFYTGDESRMVNGVLDRIAHDIRGDEFNTKD